MSAHKDELRENTPIIVGVGQITDHWFAGDPEDAPSPQSLRHAASRAALDDSGRSETLGKTIDRIVAVRTTPDSIPGAPQPFGRCANPPATLAADLGLAETEGFYSQLGGDQPQTLVNETAEAIYRGEAGTVLIAGSEATRALKSALKAGIALDWSRSSEGPMTDLGFGGRLLSPYEIANGLGAPTQTYPAFENALREKMGLDVEAYRKLMAELLEKLSAIASRNPHAQFPQERSAEFLAVESGDNYAIADPHLKWHVAQETVNQGAALILTSVGEARRLGLAPEKWIYLHGYAEAKDRFVTERPDLATSLPIELALSGALDSAGLTSQDIALLDIYSCFPCVVFLACEALRIDWRTRPVTVTGGLPFFGGPGNNYSLHAIATMSERLRAAPDQYGLVLANGGFMSKESAGVYSARPAHDWSPVSSAAIQAQLDARPEVTLLDGPCEATIESYTVTYRRGVAERAYVIASDADGRVLARLAKGDTATIEALRVGEPIGKSVTVVREGDVNVIERIGQ